MIVLKEWSSWLTDGFRQEKKERSWPSQAHHLGLLAMIWMGALSLQLFGVNKLCIATGSKCVGRVNIYIRPYWKISYQALLEDFISFSFQAPGLTFLHSLLPHNFPGLNLGLTSFQCLHCLYFWLLEKVPELASSKALEADFMASGSSVPLPSPLLSMVGDFVRHLDPEALWSISQESVL